VAAVKRPARQAALAKLVRENPYCHLTRDEISDLFEIGRDSLVSLIERGAPVVAKGINPDHLKTWLWENRERIGKLTD
jgi:hypothetical protein